MKREFFHLVCVVRLEFAYSTIARPPTNECGAVLVSRASLKVRFILQILLRLDVSVTNVYSHFGFLTFARCSPSWGKPAQPNTKKKPESSIDFTSKFAPGRNIFIRIHNRAERRQILSFVTWWEFEYSKKKFTLVFVLLLFTVATSSSYFSLSSIWHQGEEERKKFWCCNWHPKGRRNHHHTASSAGFDQFLNHPNLRLIISNALTHHTQMDRFHLKFSFKIIISSLSFCLRCCSVQTTAFHTCVATIFSRYPHIIFRCSTI